mmetsp:Transcript_5535/g.13821  ORF Transcript_5535/g.13821 Transcript_5535/m.13821 type:complete len:341 (+) Transcript_5535:787-1809(+)
MRPTRFLERERIALLCASSRPRRETSRNRALVSLAASTSTSNNTCRNSDGSWPLSKELRALVVREYAASFGARSSRHGPSSSTTTFITHSNESGVTDTTVVRKRLLSGSVLLTISKSPSVNWCFGSSSPDAREKRTRSLPKKTLSIWTLRPTRTYPSARRRSRDQSVKRSFAWTSSSRHSTFTSLRKCCAHASALSCICSLSLYAFALANASNWFSSPLFVLRRRSVWEAAATMVERLRRNSLNQAGPQTTRFGTQSLADSMSSAWSATARAHLRLLLPTAPRTARRDRPGFAAAKTQTLTISWQPWPRSLESAQGIGCGATRQGAGRVRKPVAGGATKA